MLLEVRYTAFSMMVAASPQSMFPALRLGLSPTESTIVARSLEISWIAPSTTASWMLGAALSRLPIRGRLLLLLRHIRYRDQQQWPGCRLFWRRGRDDRWFPLQ